MQIEGGRSRYFEQAQHGYKDRVVIPWPYPEDSVKLSRASRAILEFFHLCHQRHNAPDEQSVTLAHELLTDVCVKNGCKDPRETERALQELVDCGFLHRDIDLEVDIINHEAYCSSMTTTYTYTLKPTMVQ
ncbi:hypothetical protein A2Z00_00795 [Candidatus Gottesmanbacteria bacterium RBG_13_45_10]|uniref:Uncharacterized protein n=1 Tax=Candidatus Gottesmanbacteria bacterium RBG_13_45_10 TaxID=1798370 RepID=A0A1F5ZGF4_9BACT|nr:MAG: hypothetical protein A2Z00_00795 [Candidatus Gottesmanbacteria bacterium RBG_13_45_10]